MPVQASRVVAAAIFASCVFAGACSEERVSYDPPTYDGDVRAILASRCTSCHGEGAQGWRATSYLDAIGCVKGGAPATLPSDDSAPIAHALADAAHKVVPAHEREVVLAWVRAGAPKFAPSVHEPSFVDPRSPRSHGRVLRAERWRSMLDATSDGACGRCHEGSPRLGGDRNGAPSGRPPNVTSSAPGAPSCTTCHAQPGGALACATCHGDGARSSPPRDACFFPEDPARAGAHAAHVAPSATRGEGFACSACHPMPVPDATISGSHGDGVVDVALDPDVGGGNFDRASRACATSCHERSGAAKPRPAWTDRGPLGCGDCHGSPPPGHYAGACTACHREADARGTSLASSKLHANGVVDLGDGSGECGACHGVAADPWPATGAHATHRAPRGAKPVECGVCHVVPTAFGTRTGHPRGGGAKVTLAGLAVARGAPASFAAGACSEVYCHGSRLMGTAAPSPSWTDASGASRKCDGCHGAPPAAPHYPSPSCSTCHPAVADPGPVISEPRRHVDGNVDR